MAKIPKTRVRYRRAPLLTLRKCGTCSMFRPPGSCTLVAGQISPAGTCDRWETRLFARRQDTGSS